MWTAWKYQYQTVKNVPLTFLVANYLLFAIRIIGAKEILQPILNALFVRKHAGPLSA